MFKKTFAVVVFLFFKTLFPSLAFAIYSDPEISSDIEASSLPYEESWANGAWNQEEEIFVSPSRPMTGEFTKVTDLHGKVVVEAGKFNVEAKIKPWSSWWYPIWQPTLHEENSTLHRYDLLVQKWTGTNPGSRDYEEKFIFDSRAEAWAGLCNAWAFASIMEEEPKKPVKIEGVEFRVRDLKALLMKAYEELGNIAPFGQRNNGEWDSVFEDIYPEEFHRFLQVYLFDKKEPFVMDHDAGIQVWNVPVYKALIKVVPDENDRGVVHVTTWVNTGSSHLDDLDFVGLKDTLRTYTYDLYGEWRGDNFHADYGLWTGSSRWDHPDYLIPRPPDNVPRRSLNSKMDINMVKRILDIARSGI